MNAIEQSGECVNTKLPCQVCGRMLTVQRNGLTKPHKVQRGAEDTCRGTGYPQERWSVGQRLRHHAGSVWEVIKDSGGPHGDYVLRCVIGTPGWMGGECEGREMRAHGEYMHRHGWTPIR